jgi:hypothetical protein
VAAPAAEGMEVKGEKIAQQAQRGQGCWAAALWSLAGALPCAMAVQHQ